MKDVRRFTRLHPRTTREQRKSKWEAHLLESFEYGDAAELGGTAAPNASNCQGSETKDDGFGIRGRECADRVAWSDSKIVAERVGDDTDLLVQLFERELASE